MSDTWFTLGGGSMRRILLFALCLIAATPVLAQTAAPAVDDQEEQLRQQQQRALETPPTPAGRVAQSSVGEVGQRQTREQAAEGVAPMGRIANRIQSRIQSRIRNRIDRNYDPRANATSPFEVAEDQARTAGQPNR